MADNRTQAGSEANHPAVDLIFRSGASFDGYTSQMRRTFGINAHERLAIAALWERGPLTMSELGVWIPLSRAAVTTLVDRLEAAKLVYRRPDTDDRRRIMVHLGEDTLLRMMPVIEPWGADVRAVIDRLGPEKWAIVSEFLEAFVVTNQQHSRRLADMGDAEIQALSRPTAAGS